MSKTDLADLFLTQKSLTEWLQDIGHKKVDALREEDNEKRERLKILNSEIGLPFDRPTQFSGEDLSNYSESLQKYLNEHGDEHCAIRLMPLKKSLPKLRMRGKTISDAYSWAKEQDVNLLDYRVDFVPHSDNSKFGTIFIVNDKGISGEIVRGGHHQLTQGIHDDGNKPYTFFYDFNDFIISPKSDEIKGALENIFKYLKVTDEKQRALVNLLNSEFSNGYLKGYFETTETDDFGMWFIDYAPQLAKVIGDISLPKDISAEFIVKGQVGCKGLATGRVVIVDENGETEEFEDGSVLVCNVTTPKLLPFMKKCSAIITDQGGILSHAAIVARELGKPCIVGTSNATKILKQNDLVEVNANTGIVTIK